MAAPGIAEGELLHRCHSAISRQCACQKVVTATVIGQGGWRAGLVVGGVTRRWG